MRHKHPACSNEAIIQTDTLEKLYHLYWNDAVRTAESILHDKSSAEDCASSAFMKLIDNLDKVAPTPCSQTKGYLIVITRNMAYREYNLKKRFIDTEEDPDDFLKELTDSSTTEEIALANISKQNLKNAFSSLPQKDADLLALKYAYDQSVVECAEILGMTVEATKKALQRARKKLALEVKKNGI